MRACLCLLFRFIGVACCLAPFSSYALGYQVTLNAPLALQPMLNQFLPLLKQRDRSDLSQTELNALVHTTPESARQLLETEGYFDAKVNVSQTTGSAQNPQYVVTVDPGAIVRWSDVSLQLSGAIARQADYAARKRQIVQKWTLLPGQPFRQADWDNSKKLALASISRDRFPLARTTGSRVTVDPGTHQARALIEIDSGPAIAFGAVEIHGLSRYPQSLVDKLADFRPGDPYQQQALLDYQSALEHSVQFSSAVVSADLARVQNDQVPVVVTLTEFPKEKLELGVTYDTDVGLGLRLGYDHNNLFGAGVSGSSVLSWNHQEQAETLGLALPRTADGYLHSATLSLKQSNVQSLVTETTELGVWRTRTTSTREWRLGMVLLNDRQHVVNQPTQTNRALIPTGGATLRALDDPLHPRSGYMWDGMLSGTSENWLSSTTFVRAYTRAVGYWTPYRPAWGTLMSRLELGQVWSANQAKIPASQLFRAGGSNSVRAYDYQSLGVAGPNGSVVGGAVIGTASLEYQIPVIKAWALALFTDAGDAADNWHDFRLKQSYGVGVRWFSPVAPIAFDLAQQQGTHKIAWNMNLGLAF